jgi:lambda repressor-like predicted transcriptional regulator
MENVEKNLAIKIAKIKRLIKLRGKTLKDVSLETGVSYFTLSRFISRRKYTTVKGTECQCNSPHIRAALAEFLEVPSYTLWHGEGIKLLDGLIEIEIGKAVRILVEQNRTLYKPKRDEAQENR